MSKTFKPASLFSLLCLLGLFCLVPETSQAKTRKVYGMELPPHAKELSKGRYASHTTFKKTLSYFKKQRAFKKKRAKWLEPVTLMGVKYVHIRSLDPKTKWSGVNIYELKGRKVRFYVLPRHRKGS